MKSALVCTALLSLLTIRTVSAEVISYYPNTPLHLGANIDIRNLTETRLPCVVYRDEYQVQKMGSEAVAQPPNTLSNSTPLGSKSEVVVEDIKDRRSLYKHLQASVQAAAQFTFFSANASASIDDEYDFSSDSFTFIVKTSSDYGEFGIRDPRLNGAARALLKPGVGGRAALEARCGTHFVSQATRSVLAAVIYQIRNVSERSAKEIKASFDASVNSGAFSGGASGSFDQIIKAALTSNNLRMRVYVVGGQGVSALSSLITDYLDIDKVRDALKTYVASQGPGLAVPVQFILTPLTVFLANQENWDLSEQSRILGDLFLLYQDGQSAYRQEIETARSASATTPMRLASQAAADKVAIVLGEVEKAAAKCKGIVANPKSHAAAKTPFGNDGVSITIMPRAFTVENLSDGGCKIPDKAYARIYAAIALPRPVIKTVIDTKSIPQHRILFAEIGGQAFFSASFIDSAGIILGDIPLSITPDDQLIATGGLDITKLDNPNTLPIAVQVTEKSGRVTRVPVGIGIIPP